LDLEEKNLSPTSNKNKSVLKILNSSKPKIDSTLLLSDF
jgi:hypothetical protein